MTRDAKRKYTRSRVIVTKTDSHCNMAFMGMADLPKNITITDTFK